jgi:WD40 repeat protein
MPRRTLAILIGLLLAPGTQAQPKVDALGDPLPPGAVARLGTLRFKHPSTPELHHNILLPTIITSVHYSADGSRLVSRAAPYDTVRVWDTSTGRALPGDWDNRVCSADEAIALSPDGALLAVQSHDSQRRDAAKAVRLWDVATGKLLRSLPPAGRFHSLEFVDGGKALVTTQADAVRWWDVATGKEWRSWKPFGATVVSDRYDPDLPPTPLYHLVLSAGAKHVLATLRVPDPQGTFLPGATVILFDVTTGKERWRLRDEKAEAAWPLVSADNRRLALLFGSHRLDIHDTADGKRLFTLPLQKELFPNDGVRGIALSADGETLALAGPDAGVYVWCARDRKWRTYQVRSGNAQHSPIRRLMLSPDGTRLVAASGGDLQFIDVATLKEVHSFVGHRGWVESVAFSADGKRLLTGGVRSDLHLREVLTWDTATWKRLKITSDQVASWRNIGICSPEHAVYLGKEGDDRLNLYDYATGKPLGRLQAPAKLHQEARGFFAPSGKFFVSLNEAEGESLVGHLYAVPSGKRLARLPNFMLVLSEARCPVAFAADGQLVAVHGLDGAIYLLETATGKEVGRLDSAPHSERWILGHLAFSPDGKHLASWNDRDHAIHFWNVRTGKKWLALPEAAPTAGLGVVCFAWSPDGRMFAVGGGNKIDLWELSTHKFRCALRGHEAEVRCLAFSPDSRLLASGSVDTTVLVWDVTGSTVAAQHRVRRKPHALRV